MYDMLDAPEFELSAWVSEIRHVQRYRRMALVGRLIMRCSNAIAMCEYYLGDHGTTAEQG